MEFWKMNGAGNDFIIIQKLKLFKKFKITNNTVQMKQ